MYCSNTVFENHRKSLIFEKLKLAVKLFYQTGHFLIGQKLAESVKIEKLNESFLVIFKHCVNS